MKTTMMKSMMLVAMMSVSTLMMANTNSRVNNNHGNGRGQRTEINAGGRGHSNNVNRGHGHQQHRDKKGWLNGRDIRGYEGRVHYHNGIWSYHRNGRWYHYNRYIDVREYFNSSLRRWGNGLNINITFHF